MTARILDLSCHIPTHPLDVWEAVQRPATMVHVARGWVEIRPVDMPDWPETWREGRYRARLTGPLGLPLGWQIIGVEFPPSQGGARFLRDRGEGQLARVWDHLIIVEAEGPGTRYTDRLKFDAGPLTPIATPLVRAFFAHRQRRLVALMTGAPG